MRLKWGKQTSLNNVSEPHSISGRPYRTLAFLKEEDCSSRQPTDADSKTSSWLVHPVLWTCQASTMTWTSFLQTKHTFVHQYLSPCGTWQNYSFLKTMVTSLVLAYKVPLSSPCGSGARVRMCFHILETCELSVTQAWPWGWGWGRGMG